MSGMRSIMPTKGNFDILFSFPLLHVPYDGECTATTAPAYVYLSRER